MGFVKGVGLCGCALQGVGDLETRELFAEEEGVWFWRAEVGIRFWLERLIRGEIPFHRRVQPFLVPFYVQRLPRSRRLTCRSRCEFVSGCRSRWGWATGDTRAWLRYCSFAVDSFASMMRKGQREISWNWRENLVLTVFHHDVPCSRAERRINLDVGVDAGLLQMGISPAEE